MIDDRRGVVANVYCDGFGVWHAEVPLLLGGNGPVECFGCALSVVRRRASHAIRREIVARMAPKRVRRVRSEFVGIVTGSDGRPVIGCDGLGLALFREA